jgi:hypothetical protein
MLKLNLTGQQVQVAAAAVQGVILLVPCLEPLHTWHVPTGDSHRGSAIVTFMLILSNKSNEKLTRHVSFLLKIYNLSHFL